MVGQAEIVVGAEEQDRLAVEHHMRALRTADQPSAPVQAQRSQLVQTRFDLDHPRPAR
jgi:hypothetical protein